MKKIWFETAWNDYFYWQGQDRKPLEKINLPLITVQARDERPKF
ncbi:MAG: type II toxin-antitoxin system YoeB family toxin [Synergistaceae bacterium]|nr:type II toxin-antitoxin system YoeB family toxin [Synergistaceae bacterium]